MYKLLITFLVLFISQTSYALQEGSYIGGGLFIVDTNFQGLNTEDNITFTGLEAQFGYKHSWYLGGEVRLGLGLIDSSFSTSTLGDVTSNLDHYQAIYYRLEKTNEVAKLYFLAGFSSVSVSSDFSGGDTSESESGLSYGVGIGFLSEDLLWTWNFEYRELLDDDAAEFTSFSITLDRRVSWF